LEADMTAPNEAPTTILQRLLAAMNAHDLDAMVSCFADDYVNETPIHPLRGFRGNEQVRKNVTNCIRHSVSMIQKTHPLLGRHLLSAIKTGVFCSYQPEQPTVWRS